MFLQRFLGNRGSVSAPKSLRAKPRLLDVVAPVMWERLEPRQLLTAYFYTVPANWTSAYLVSPIAGVVEVRRDGPNGELGTTFTQGEGMYVVQSTMNGFLFVDQVAAANKPTADSFGDNGTKVELINNATGGHLKIEAEDIARR